MSGFVILGFTCIFLIDDEDDDEEKVVKDVKDWLGKRYEVCIFH